MTGAFGEQYSPLRLLRGALDPLKACRLRRHLLACLCFLGRGLALGGERFAFNQLLLRRSRSRRLGGVSKSHFLRQSPKRRSNCHRDVFHSVFFVRELLPCQLPSCLPLLVSAESSRARAACLASLSLMAILDSRSCFLCFATAGLKNNRRLRRRQGEAKDGPMARAFRFNPDAACMASYYCAA
jgi:hypothetical protein